MIHVEIEAKFAIPDRSLFDRLSGVTALAGFSVGEPIINQVTDHYLDTPDWAILATGYACRVREGEGDRVLTLKSLGQAAGAVRRRVEHEVLLDTGVPFSEAARWLASSAKEMVEEAIADRPLEHHLTLRQTRHVHSLMDGDRPVAELSLDQIWFQNSDPIYELEVELLPAGTAADLEQIVRVLADEWELSPVSLSKFERGLQMGSEREQRRMEFPTSVEDEGPPGEMKDESLDILPDDPMSEAGRKTLRLHFERMLAHEAGTRLGEDIEELHDMRVATRRMRAAFRVFGPYFDPKTIKPHLKGLKLTGRALGPVRDLDVFEEKAQGFLATVPADQVGALDGLLAAWREKRAFARARMLAYLDSQRYARFVRRFGSFLSREGVGALPSPVGAPVPYQVRHIAPQLIYTRYEAVRAYEPLLDSAPIDLLHALRIDFKQLRYASEFFDPVLGREAQAVIKEIKAMQDHLGDLNDADVATRLLHNFLQDRPQGQEGLLVYLRDREGERDRLLASFPAAWVHYSRPEVSRNLALAVAAL